MASASRGGGHPGEGGPARPPAAGRPRREGEKGKEEGRPGGTSPSKRICPRRPPRAAGEEEEEEELLGGGADGNSDADCDRTFCSKLFNGELC